MINTHQIARRAYGQYSFVETFAGTWVHAQLHAMKLEAEKRDGEYFVFAPGETIGPRPSVSYQSGFDWL